MVSAFAPGKIILSGEHSVVYGYPAITMAIQLGVTARIEPIDGPSHTTTFPEDTVLWKAIREVVPEYGYKVAFSANVPFGKGMGSSAALSIALIRAMNRAGSLISLEEELRLGMAMEKHFHGTPSGIDHTTSALGMGLYFQKGPPVNIQPFAIENLQLLVIDSGEVGNTKEMVAHVRQVHQADPTIMPQIGECTEAIRAALAAQEIHKVGTLFNKNHEILRSLGVSTDTIERLRDVALANGALGVKISGSGGGGILIALVENPLPLQTLFDNMKIHSFPVQPFIQPESVQ